MRYRIAWTIPLLCILVGCAAEAEREQLQNQVTAAMENYETAAAEAETVAFNVAGAPTYEYSVPGMMCEEGCAVVVRQALSEQPGVKEVQIDFPAKIATVAVDDDVFDAEATATLLEEEYGFADTTLKTSSTENAVPADGVEETATTSDIENAG